MDTTYCSPLPLSGHDQLLLRFDISVLIDKDRICKVMQPPLYRDDASQPLFYYLQPGDSPGMSSCCIALWQVCSLHERRKNSGVRTHKRN